LRSVDDELFLQLAKSKQPFPFRDDRKIGEGIGRRHTFFVTLACLPLADFCKTQ
jgi:hypothetical protein